MTDCGAVMGFCCRNAVDVTTVDKAEATLSRSEDRVITPDSMAGDDVTVLSSQSQPCGRELYSLARAGSGSRHHPTSVIPKAPARKLFCVREPRNRLRRAQRPAKPPAAP